MPQTLHLDARNLADIHRAADLLRAGKLVAFATETVYGLGANALDETAVASIFSAKQRPAWDPLIVHLADISQLPTVADIPKELAPRILQLAKAFWPGPLTLLLPRTPAISDSVTAGRPLVGIRIPAHDTARTLLRAAAIPVAAPSANRFGHTSPTTADHVLSDLDTRIDAVLDAGPTAVGLESTVLDPATMTLYRPGAVTADQITAATSLPVTIFVPPTTHTTPESLPSPGVGIRHYAPNARLILTAPTPEALVAAIPQTNDKRFGILLPTNWPAPINAKIFPWGSWTNPEQLAQNLFAGLRSLDDQQADLILAPLPPPGGLHDALRDRLQKAARTE